MDLDQLFSALGKAVSRHRSDDKEFGDTLRQMLGALVRFDHAVVFAYLGMERPIELYSTFDPDEHLVFVTLYQAGPYMLDPFFHAARERKTGLFRMRELAPDRFYSSEYYRTYYVKTGLAEEVGLFVTLDDEVSVVLSLMRKRVTGSFPSREFALLRRTSELAATMVAQHWSGLGRRFEAAQATRGGRHRKQAANPETVWHSLKLTAREAAVVELVLQGHSSESIGLRLGISTGTVKVHRRNVYRKLGISSQTQLLSIYLTSVE